MLLWGRIGCLATVSVSSFRNWDHVTCVDAAKGTVAVGTSSGVVLMGSDGQKTKTLSTSNGAPFSAVRRLSVGIDGSLWVCGKNGGNYRYWQQRILNIESDVQKSIRA